MRIGCKDCGGGTRAELYLLISSPLTITRVTNNTLLYSHHNSGHGKQGWGGRRSNCTLFAVCNGRRSRSPPAALGKHIFKYAFCMWALLEGFGAPFFQNSQRLAKKCSECPFARAFLVIPTTTFQKGASLRSRRLTKYYSRDPYQCLCFYIIRTELGNI